MLPSVATATPRGMSKKSPPHVRCQLSVPIGVKLNRNASASSNAEVESGARDIDRSIRSNGNCGGTFLVASPREVPYHAFPRTELRKEDVAVTVVAQHHNA